MADKYKAIKIFMRETGKSENYRKETAIRRSIVEYPGGRVNMGMHPI